MTKKLNLDAADAALRAGVAKPALIEPGQNTLEIVKVTADAVKNGSFQGKPVLNIEFESSLGNKVWKIVPMWVPDTQNDKEVSWVKMARIALVDALGITSNELASAPEKLIGQLVQAKVGVQTNEGYPDQNYIVTFVAE